MQRDVIVRHGATRRVAKAFLPGEGTLYIEALPENREKIAICAEELRAAGVPILMKPKDRPWDHRTLFFRDPDGNIIEIYADL